MSKNIFDYIEENLCGETKQTALEFAEFLYSSNIEFIKDNGYWKDKIYYLCKFNDEYVCFIAIKDPEEPENNWTIWFEDSEDFKDDSIDKNTRVFAWGHIGHCGDCGSCNGGKTRNIFGQMFENVCSCTFRIDNPKLNDLPFLKNLVCLRIRNPLDSTLDDAFARSTLANGKSPMPNTKSPYLKEK